MTKQQRTEILAQLESNDAQIINQAFKTIKTKNLSNLFKEILLEDHRYKCFEFELFSILKDITYLYIGHDSSNINLANITRLTKIESLQFYNVPNLNLKKNIHYLVELKNLSELSIENCQLVSLPPQFSKLKNLKKLSLRENKFEYIPKEIFTLKKLWYLSIGKPLRSIPLEIKNLSSLQTFASYNHQIKKLPLEMGQLKNLSNLSLPNFSNGKNAPLLNIEHIVEVIKSVPNFRYLSLEGNGITKIPKSIKELQQLRYLSLGNNRLKKVPNEVLDLPYLEDFDITGYQISRKEEIRIQEKARTIRLNIKSDSREDREENLAKYFPHLKCLD